MKLILINGEEYAVLTFENSKLSIKDIYKEMQETGKDEVIKEIDGEDIRFSLCEFKDVDPKFISFVKDIFCDYDMLKHEDFIVVEE